MRKLTVQTRHGEARVALGDSTGARGALILGHGAGGGVNAPDLQATARAAERANWAIGLVEQPYRVAGRRAPAPAPRLDESWLDVIAALAGDPLTGVPLVTGGRSSGARVACRTAAAAGVVGVVCLAFPLLPPGRAGSAKRPQSRLDELDAVTVPTLVVQGRQDRFGLPPSGANRIVIAVAGDHSLRSAPAAVGEAVESWLCALPA